MLVCDGHFRQFNPAFVELMGGTASQLLGLGVSVLFGGPGHSDLFTARVTPSLAAGQALRETATLFRLDGSRFEARLAGRSLKMDDFGTASIWVIEDVSDQRRAELAIQQTKERLELAQEAGKIGVFDLNLLTGEILWSDKLAQMMGLPPAAWHPTRWPRFLAQLPASRRPPAGGGLFRQLPGRKRRPPA